MRLLALEPRDRYLRFGPAARDEQITRYVERLDFDRDEVFAIFSRGSELIAVAYLAHAAVAPQPQAEMASQKGNHAIKRQASRQIARASFWGDHARSPGHPAR